MVVTFHHHHQKRVYKGEEEAEAEAEAREAREAKHEKKRADDVEVERGAEAAEAAEAVMNIAGVRPVDDVIKNIIIHVAEKIEFLFLISSIYRIPSTVRYNDAIKLDSAPALYGICSLFKQSSTHLEYIFK